MNVLHFHFHAGVAAEARSAQAAQLARGRAPLSRLSVWMGLVAAVLLSLAALAFP